MVYFAWTSVPHVFISISKLQNVNTDFYLGLTTLSGCLSLRLASVHCTDGGQLRSESKVWGDPRLTSNY